MRDVNKYKGCLLGGAVGDALGYAVEFSSAASILQTYGACGITDYKLRRGVAEISDDTQMTLFTAAGLLRAATDAGSVDRMSDDRAVRCIADAYRDWYRTQTEPYPLPDAESGSRLLQIPALFSLRAPGNTCLSALAEGGNGTPEHPINKSKGCGGVMRVAPIGLFFCDTKRDPLEIDRLGARAAALTHGHELGYLPAAMLTHMLYRIAGHEDSIADAVEDALCALPAVFPNARHMDELLSLIRKAAALAGESTDDLDAIRELGEGWVAEETLAIAVYCALKYTDDFEKGIVAAVNHDGDSDSTGAVAGNLLGAALGANAIPQKYLDRLELKDLIVETAESLYTAN